MLTFYRLLLASIILLIFCKIRNEESLFKNKKGLTIIALFGNVIPFNLISWSELYVESVVASSLIGTMPLFTYLISLHFPQKKKFYLKPLLGLLIGFLGMFIFLGLGKEFSNSFSPFFSIIIIFSAILYAYSANFVKTLSHQTALEIATGSTIVATLISLPLTIIIFNLSDYQIQNHISNITLNSFLSATALSLICTALASIIFFKIIQVKSAVFASQSNYLIPCFGFFWSYIFLTENLTPNLLIGLLLIVLGGYLVNKNY